jgi:hypothetical protein
VGVLTALHHPLKDRALFAHLRSASEPHHGSKPDGDTMTARERNSCERPKTSVLHSAWRARDPLAFKPYKVVRRRPPKAEAHRICMDAADAKAQCPLGIESIPGIVAPASRHATKPGDDARSFARALAHALVVRAASITAADRIDYQTALDPAPFRRLHAAGGDGFAVAPTRGVSGWKNRRAYK